MSGRRAKARRKASPKVTVTAGRYEWPIVTALHSEHGSFQFDIHGIASSENPGVLTVLACDHGLDRRKQIDMVFATAAGMGDTVVEMQDSDISDRLALTIAARMFAEEGKGEPAHVFVLPGAEHGLSSAGRRPARYPSTYAGSDA